MTKIEAGCFKDEFGRTLMLRGVNLGGSSKVPFSPNGATWNKEGFYDHRNVSFVGRPFPLGEADEHFSRLRAWGFTFVRFLVTWEAIEHAGPGIYDEAYLDYLRAIIKKGGEHGMRILIDPHQDAWSRFTGGDGAPGWTLEKAGFDLRRLHATGAAVVHQEHGEPFPHMIWSTNYNKLSAGTMFTLFFAGNDLAPNLIVDGIPIQEYLQSHYIRAIQQVALRLKDLSNVIGYECLNEPSTGFIGQTDINQPPQAIPLMMGDTPTLYQSLLMGSGYVQTVDRYKLGLRGFAKAGTRLANPNEEEAWLPGREDVWREHGVWGEDADGQPILHKPDYFSRVNGKQVNFYADYFKPFVNRFAREMRSIVPEAIIFVGGVPSQGELAWEATDAPDIVFAPHWYDGLTLLRKSFISWMTVDQHTRKMVLGSGGVRRCFTGQIAKILRHSHEQMNGAPLLIGEVGIPFDMQDKKAYRNGDFSMQIRALDATMAALEQNLVSFALWNYTADNSNARGDQWNGEDLSLFSPDQMSDSGSIYDGGRALRAALRPYPLKIAGEPLSLHFDIRRASFEFSFRHAEAVNHPTEVFVPNCQYARGFTVEVPDGTYDWDEVHQILSYRHSSARDVHSIRIKPA